MLTTCDICGDLCNYNSEHPDVCEECAAEFSYLDDEDGDDFDDELYDNNYDANDGTEGGG